MNAHRPLLDILAEVSARSPDIRFGQLLANVGLLVEDHADQSLWDIADAELLTILESHLADLVRLASTTDVETSSEGMASRQ